MTNFADKFELILEYDSEDRIEYVKKAKPGIRTDDSEWQILKLFYDGLTTAILRLAYANNNPLFEFVADDYLSYKYTPVYETFIIPLQNISAGSVFDLSGSTSEYTIQGDTADLLVSEALFNNADFITINRGNEEFRKEIEAVWQSQTTILFNKSVKKDESILITS